MDVGAYRVPTVAPEADGTFEWNATTLVVVQVVENGETGVGYTYADRATSVFIDEHLRPRVVGATLLSPAAAWASMRHAVRNVGRPGVASMAIAAVDAALWDLAARRRGVALAEFLGARRRTVPLYGSGGFTTYDSATLTDELECWLR